MLKDVFCYANNVPTTKTSAFVDSSISTATLHVPAASIGTYQATLPWSGFGCIVPLTDEEMAIGRINDNGNTNDSPTYDLNGRRISDNSNFKMQNSKLKKGIYIVNGKKVLVR